MTQIQSGILLEHRRFAIFIEAMIQGEFDAIRQGCKKFCQSLQELQARFPDAGLGATLAFGHDVWRDLDCAQGAAELKPFAPLGKGLAPATQRDLLLHIQSLRHDVNFSLAQAALAAFGSAIRVEEETHGFRWVEDRDLSGFVDGTENPQGDARRDVAIIADEQPDAGGSYVFVQRWEHNLKQLQRFSVEQQEQMIGRTKQDNEEIPAEQRPTTSHLSRVDLKEEGKGLKILRQSMPYGTASGKHGLYFIAYCARLHNIEQQLLSMFGDRDGKRDEMLRFTRAVSGSYFFAPSLEKLLAL
ncbi:Dyp-type peroxidase [Candidatus Symbiopectobacterium sp. NZEC151]|uniref:Dyp-type peroxidase n=1 Tax=Candidatus Symbiopectobacterium sp. NZEC151 TaxID=2820470 RepID=UPI002227468C|nr:Dyp-type peroxidase [Candidatus Symbiopectobacterium sp. NZEC151]MCW2475070.1 Dyp-type peroxidase [Candidatus Symbiopectobacterium sp. NZEC151]